MFHLFLKPFLGLVTVGGLATGSYFLYKHSVTKNSSESKDVDGSTVGTEAVTRETTKVPTTEGNPLVTETTSTATTTGTGHTSSHVVTEVP